MNEIDRCPFCKYPYGSLWKKHNKLYERKKTKDHIIPLIRGGRNRPDNIMYCCLRCNQFKGNLLLHEWRDLIAKSLANMDPQSGIIKVKGESASLINYKIADLRVVLKSIEGILNQKNE